MEMTYFCGLKHHLSIKRDVMKLVLNSNEILTKNGVSYLIPFILITACFTMWGFASDMTGPIVKAFSKIFRMSVTEGSMVQVAYYLGYFDDVPCRIVHSALFVQGGSDVGHVAIRCWYADVSAGKDDWNLFPIPHSLFSADMWCGFP